MQQVEEINPISLVGLCARLHYQLGSCNGKMFFPELVVQLLQN